MGFAVKCYRGEELKGPAGADMTVGKVGISLADMSSSFKCAQPVSDAPSFKSEGPRQGLKI